MRKVSVVIVGILMLLMACNKETPSIPPLPPDSTAPTFDFEFVSIASTLKFIPFGGTLPNNTVNKGYELSLSDTTQNILTACPGIVTSIVPDTSAAGGNLITIKLNRNSVYTVVYGGVTNVIVNVNDSLQGGNILGKIAGSGIVDFQVVMNNNQALCPSTYASSGFNTAIQQAILLSNNCHCDSVISTCTATSLPY